MKTRGAWQLCSIAWILNACGSAASYDYDLPPSDDGPTLAQRHGKIVEAPDAPNDIQSKLVRVALIWLPVSPNEGKFQISQNVTTPTKELGEFDIDISQQPPGDAIQRADMMRYGQAEIVLYEDRNSNNRLDITPGYTSPDRVLGRAKGVRVWWLGGGMPAPLDARGYKPVTNGWSFTYGPISAEPDATDCAPDPAQGGALHPTCRPKVTKQATEVSQMEPIAIEVSNNPILPSYACFGFWGTSPDKSDEWPDNAQGWSAPELRDQICDAETCACQDRQDGTVCPLDLPVAGRKVTFLSCSDTAYVWKDCIRDAKLCNMSFCHYGHGERTLDQPRPDNWPVCPN